MVISGYNTVKVAEMRQHEIAAGNTIKRASNPTLSHSNKTNEDK